MFAVNGPSGPTTRCERRRRSDAEVAAKERRKELEAQHKRDRFFRPATGGKKVVCDDGDHDEGGQAETEQAASARGEQPMPRIFQGCRIVFNGRTGKVSSYYLAKLVEEHGGNVNSMQMIKPSRITHMVGSNLSASKADKALKKLGKLKFVTADWILQSVKQHKRLPEFDFLVYKDDRAAATFRSAFTPSPASS